MCSNRTRPWFNCQCNTFPKNGVVLAVTIYYPLTLPSPLLILSRLRENQSNFTNFFLEAQLLLVLRLWLSNLTEV